MDQRWQRVARVDRRRRRGFGQLAPGGIDREGHMRIARPRQAQEPLKVDLPRCGGQEIGAAHDVGHALCRVIDHDRQLVGMDAVRAAQDEIADFAGEVLIHGPMHAVLDPDSRVIDAQPLAARAPAGPQAITTGTGIDRSFATEQPFDGDVAAGATARIAEAAATQLGEGVGILGGAPALIQHRLLPVQPEGIQRTQDGVCRTWHIAGAVEVLDAHQPGAGMGKGVGVAGDRGQQ